MCRRRRGRYPPEYIFAPSDIGQRRSLRRTGRFFLLNLRMFLPDTAQTHTLAAGGKHTSRPDNFEHPSCRQPHHPAAEDREASEQDQCSRPHRRLTDISPEQIQTGFPGETRQQEVSKAEKRASGESVSAGRKTNHSYVQHGRYSARRQDHRQLANVLYIQYTVF